MIHAIAIPSGQGPVILTPGQPGPLQPTLEAVEAANTAVVAEAIWLLVNK